MSISNSVEITVLVELFSTFFEKSANSHLQKDILLKYLNQFKNFLYKNSNNLENGFEFIEQMKQSVYDLLSQKKVTENNYFKLVNLQQILKENLIILQSQDEDAFINKFKFGIDYFQRKNQFYILICVQYFYDLLFQQNGKAILQEIIEMVENKNLISNNSLAPDSCNTLSFHKAQISFIREFKKILKLFDQQEIALETFINAMKEDIYFTESLGIYLREFLLQFILYNENNQQFYELDSQLAKASVRVSLCNEIKVNLTESSQLLNGIIVNALQINLTLSTLNIETSQLKVNICLQGLNQEIKYAFSNQPEQQINIFALANQNYNKYFLLILSHNSQLNILIQYFVNNEDKIIIETQKKTNILKSIIPKRQLIENTSISQLNQIKTVNVSSNMIDTENQHFLLNPIDNNLSIHEKHQPKGQLANLKLITNNKSKVENNTEIFNKFKTQASFPLIQISMDKNSFNHDENLNDLSKFFKQNTLKLLSNLVGIPFQNNETQNKEQNISQDQQIMRNQNNISTNCLNKMQNEKSQQEIQYGKHFKSNYKYSKPMQSGTSHPESFLLKGHTEQSIKPRNSFQEASLYDTNKMMPSQQTYISQCTKCLRDFVVYGNYKKNSNEALLCHICHE